MTPKKRPENYGAAKKPEKMVVPLPGCYGLDENLKKCRRVSVGCFMYHGDSELYTWGDDEPRTVLVWLCKKHKGTTHLFRGDLD